MKTTKFLGILSLFISLSGLGIWTVFAQNSAVSDGNVIFSSTNNTPNGISGSIVSFNISISNTTGYTCSFTGTNTGFQNNVTGVSYSGINNTVHGNNTTWTGIVDSGSLVNFLLTGKILNNNFGTINYTGQLNYSCYSGILLITSGTLSITGIVNGIPDLYVNGGVVTNRPRFLGDSIGFRINYGNIGSQIAIGVIFSGNIPSYVNNISTNILGVQSVISNLFTISDISPININSGGFFTISGNLNRVYHTGGLSNDICMNVSINPLNDFNLFNNTANQVCTSIEPLPDLSIGKCLVKPGDNSNVDRSCLDKSDSYLTNIKIGDSINYKLTIKNIGVTGTSLPVIVKDILPSNIIIDPSIIIMRNNGGTWIPCTNSNNSNCGITQKLVGNILTLSGVLFSDFQNDKEYIIIISGTLNTNLGLGLPLINTGTIKINGDTSNYILRDKSTSLEGNYLNNLQTPYQNNITGVSYTVGGLPYLSVTKTCIAGCNLVNIGDEVTFRITYRNTGTKLSTGFKIVDIFPVQLTGYTQTERTTGTLNPGQSGFIDVKAKLTGHNLLQGVSIFNTVYLTGYGESANILPIIATGEAMIGSGPNLWIKAILTGYVPHFSGDQVKFIISFGNSGNINATGVNITGNIFNILTGLTNTLNTSISNLGNGNFSLSVTDSDVEIGDLTTFDLYGTLPSNYQPGTKICLNATIQSSAKEVMADNQVINLCTEVEAIADINVNKYMVKSDLQTKVDSGYLQKINSGDILFYRIDITNSGNKSANNVQISDAFGSGLVFKSLVIHGPNNIIPYNPGSQTGEIYAIGTGEQWYAIYEFIVNKDTFVQNGINIINTGMAKIIGDTYNFQSNYVPNYNDINNFESDYTKNISTAFDRIGGQPDIRIAKQWINQSTPPIKTGDQIVYQITYGNSGDRISNGFTITDSFPVEFTGYSFPVGGVAVTGLVAGGTGRLIVTGQLANVPSVFLNGVSGQINNGYVFVNTGIITGFVDVYNDLGTNYATGPVMIGDAPNLWVNIFATGTNPTKSGDYVRFDVAMGNNGSMTATGVSFSGFFSNISGLLTKYFDTIEIKDLSDPSIRIGSTDAINFYSNKDYQSALDNFATGTIYSFTIGGKLRQNFSANSSVCISASVKGYQTELMNDNSDADCVLVSPIADLQIVAKYVTGTDLNYVQSGSIITYRIDFTNNGSKIISGFIQDILPTELTFFTGARYISSVGRMPTNLVTPAVSDRFYIGSGEKGYALLQARLNTDIVGTGLCFTNTVSISGYDTESNYNNNTGYSTDCIPGLADITITKDLVSANPSRSGDQVGFKITVTHNSGRPADIILQDLLPTELRYTSSTYNILSKCPGIDQCRFGTISSGQTATIYLTGTLRQQYPVGTIFINTGAIPPAVGLLSTTGYFDTATGIVLRNCDFDINMTVDNLTHNSTPLNLNALNPKQAISGDYLVWIINYTNVGNTTGNINSIFLTNLFQESFSNPFTSQNGPGIIQPGSYTRGSNFASNLPMGSGGSIIITGIVAKNNFNLINPTALINFNCGLDGESLNDSTSGLVIEPAAVCGDGLITRNETCDTNGNIGVLMQGQECQNQNGVCVLVTKEIINRVCMDFGVNLGNLSNQIFIGSGCANSILTLRTPGCDYLTGNKATIVSASGLDVIFSCQAKDIVPGTYISLDCGNTGASNKIYSGFGLASITGLCTYTTTGTDVFNTVAKCSVGLDTGNQNCQVPVQLTPTLPPAYGDCKSLTALDGIVLLTDGDENASGRFRCETNSGVSATIKIDCGNGDSNTVNGSSSSTHTCNFDYGVPPSNIHDVICYVNGNTASLCKESVKVDKPMLGYCGNGVLEGYEQCDKDGTRNRTMNDGKNCTNCHIANQESVGCLNVNTSISVMDKEQLPFARRLENADKLLTTCTVGNPGPMKSNMQCTFAVYNGNKQEVNNNPFNTIRTDCENVSNEQIFNYYLSKASFYPTFAKAFGKKIFTPTEYFESGIYGEYKITLTNVKYDYCKADGTIENGVELDRVCSVNFAVTKPYIIQKSSLGATPKASLNLTNFLDINGNQIQNNLQSTMIVDNNSFNGVADNKTVNALVDNFANKYEKLSVKLSDTQLGISSRTDLTIRKVPGKQIYFIESTSTMKKPLTIDVSSESYLIPFTLITKNLDLIIKGNVKENVNGMFVVRGGTVSFNSTDCNKRQVVNGIFIAQNGFIADTNPIINDSTSKERCNQGGLTVRGVLIGSNIDILAQSKRSHLNDRFLTNSTNFDNEAIRLERRDKLFAGASLLIEYSSSLWTNLPPGAEDFTQALQVYKR